MALAPVASESGASTRPLPPPRKTDAESAFRPRGAVVSVDLGAIFGLYPIPSGELSLALGGAIPMVPPRPGSWIGLAYRGTLTYGPADLLGERADANFFHRHHFAILGVGGAGGRFVYGASLGGALGVRATEASRLPLVIEGEGRVGYRFGGDSMNSRGMIGAKFRVSGAPGGVPLPGFGLFIGVYFGNGLEP